jgi:hypothetical protein
MHIYFAYYFHDQINLKWAVLNILFYCLLNVGLWNFVWRSCRCLILCRKFRRKLEKNRKATEIIEEHVCQLYIRSWSVATYVCCVTCCSLYSSNVHSLPQIVELLRRKKRIQVMSKAAVDIRTSFSHKGHRGEGQVTHQVEEVCDREGKQGHAVITLWQWRNLILIHSHTKREKPHERKLFYGRTKNTRHFRNS